MFFISERIVPEVAIVVTSLFFDFIDCNSFIAFSFSIWLHLIIPTVPLNWIRRIPNSLQVLLNKEWHWFCKSLFISDLVNSLSELFTTNPMYLLRLPSFTIENTPKNERRSKKDDYSDSTRGARRYVTCPFFSAMSKSTRIGLPFPKEIVMGSSAFTALIILLK